MYLFKTSGRTLGSVVANQKHACRGRPKVWVPGEYVLVSKNRADCAPSERQIQYIMRLARIRPLRPGEAETYWPGTEGRWTYLVECEGTQRLGRPFNLSEALGIRAAPYQGVMTFRRLDPADECGVEEFLRRSNPGVVE